MSDYGTTIGYVFYLRTMWNRGYHEHNDMLNGQLDCQDYLDYANYRVRTQGE